MDNNYRLGIYEKALPASLSWKEKFKYAKLAGFDFMEMSIDESDEKLERLSMSQDQIKALNALMVEMNFKIESICLSGHRRYPLGSESNDVQQHSLMILKKAVNLAVKLGIPIIQLAGYDEYYQESNEQTKMNFIKNLKKTTEYASMFGILLGFETMETPFMDTVKKAMTYVSEVNSPYLQVYPDIGNLTNAALLYHHSVGDDLLSGKGHLIAAHLKETIPGHYREIPFETGHVDFLGNIKLLMSLGVKRYVVEFWYLGEENWFDIALTNQKFIRQTFKECTNEIIC